MQFGVYSAWRARRVATSLASKCRLVFNRSNSSGSPRLVQEGDDLCSWLGDVPPAPYHNYPLLEQAATRWSHHTAIQCGVTGQSYSYGDLLDLWRRVGSAMERRGLGGRGAVSALLLPNCPDFAVIFGGVMASGTSPAPLNPTLTPGEVARQIKGSGASSVIAHPHLARLAETALNLLPHPRPPLLLVGGTEGGREDLLEEAKDPNTPFIGDVKIEDEDVCVVLFSSGTTGLPKATPSTQGSVRHNLSSVLHPQFNSLHSATGESQETLLGLMPFFHAWGVYSVLNCGLMHGAKIVTVPTFSPELFLKCVSNYKIGVLHVVPPLIQFLVGHPAVTSHNLSSLRVVMCAAAPCPAPAANALKMKAPNPIFFQEAYGMTETMPTHVTPLGHEQLGSCGMLLPGVKARVVPISDADGSGDGEVTSPSLPPNTPGELLIKSPGVMSGYLNDPTATRETITCDHWLKTGDVVTYDEQGRFYVVDRIKELIKVKGHQVSPSEIEAELLKMKDIEDVGVVGVPDERLGEAPRAYVVPRDPTLSEEGVKDFLKGRLAEFKQVEGGVVFVKELPKSPAGKLLRRMLKEWGNEGRV